MESDQGRHWCQPLALTRICKHVSAHPHNMCIHEHIHTQNQQYKSQLIVWEDVENVLVCKIYKELVNSIARKTIKLSLKMNKRLKLRLFQR